MNEKIRNIDIAEEMEKSFLDYSMSVIVSRALPDVRDGLKPVHRRILYAMYSLGITHDKPYKKSARIVGDVIGKYHPHGDAAVYDSMVRMAQDFAYRYTLVDGHGNFGSIDGYGAAAMRYTESRASRIASEMLRDINKDTVDFEPNYDGEETEPTVLPSRFPNILVNGTMGIAVGMATNIPPHNLREVINGCVAYIENNDITPFELMEYIKGPDFPTGAIILGNSGIKKAYETGRGSITIRSRAVIEEVGGRSRIVVTEIPYQINKSNLITKIAELAREKVIEGISEMRDESNLEGIKIVIELKREANANVVLNNLYKYTSLQTTYGINFLALCDGQPKLLNLKQIIEKYIDHQRVVVIRRSKFDLDKNERRAHILEGFVIALNNIDEIIKLIRSSKTDQEALQGLMSKFNLSKEQAEAILEMRLRRLTGLEREKIESELEEVLKIIKELRELLASNEKIMNLIKEELIEIREKYSDERKTEIDMTSIDYIEDESLIPVEDIVITMTNKGYIKRITSETYRTQNRGGVGVKGMTTNEEDFVENVLSMKTHDYLLFFTNKGKVYRIKGYEIPLFSRQSKGIPIVNLLPIEKDEVVKTMLKVETDEQCKYLVFCTQSGLVKRVLLTDFDNIRKTGKLAITLREDDELINVKKTTGNNEILVSSSNGRMVRFDENEIRVMGRTAAGVKGIELDNSVCIGLEISDKNQKILVVTENGFGKITPVEEYRMTKRGSKGVKALNITEKNKNLVAFKSIYGDEDLIIITDNGIVIRMPINQVSETGRVTQGVKLINLKEDQKVSAVAIIKSENTDIEDNE